MSIIQRLKDEGKIILDIDFTKNTLTDDFNNITATVTNSPQFVNTAEGRAIRIRKGASQKINIANQASLEFDQGYILVFGDFIDGGDTFNGRITTKRSAAALQWDIFFSGFGVVPTIATVGGNSTASLASTGLTSWYPFKGLGVKVNNVATVATFYRNGVAMAGSGNHAITAQSQPIGIGNYISGDFASTHNYRRMILINDNINVTDADIAAIYEEVQASQGALVDCRRNSTSTDLPFTLHHPFVDVPPTIDNVSDGPIPHTEFYAQSAALSVTKDSDGKGWMEAAGAGAIGHIASSQADGTFMFQINKTDEIVVTMLADTVENVLAAGSNNSYSMRFEADGTVSLLKRVAGVDTTLFETASGFISDSTTYFVAVTRSGTGEFTAYIKGGAYANWTLMTAATGSNPVTDNVVTTAGKFFVRFSSVGDKAAGFAIYSDALTTTQLQQIQ